VETAVPLPPAAEAVARAAVALGAALAVVEALGAGLAAVEALGRALAAVGATDAAVDGAVEDPPPVAGAAVGGVSPPHDARRNAARPTTPPAMTCLRVTLLLTLPTPSAPTQYNAHWRSIPEKRSVPL